MYLCVVLFKLGFQLPHITKAVHLHLVTVAEGAGVYLFCNYG
jgi:hypothetical protein